MSSRARRASASSGNGFYGSSDRSSDRRMEDSYSQRPPSNGEAANRSISGEAVHRSTSGGTASVRPTARAPLPTVRAPLPTAMPAKVREPEGKPAVGSKSRGGSSKGRPVDVILLVRRFFRVASAFFWGDEKWRARGMMALLIALACGGTGMHVLISYTRKDFANALTEKNAADFYAVVVRFAAIIAFAAPFFGVDAYVSGRMVLEWRVWLTRLLLKHYFSNRAFFNLKMEGILDNPDQRICEDTANFVNSSVTVLKVLVEKLLSIFAFSAVLWSISPSVVAFLLTYAFLGTYITLHLFGKQMMRLKFEGLQREADMRYALVRVRDNVEAIAFYRGEQREAAAARGFLDRLAHNVQDRLRWTFFLEVFTNGYRFATFLIPGLVLAPRLFRGEIRYGDVVQTSMAFHEIFRAVTVIVVKFDLLSSLAAETERLESLLAALGLSGEALSGNAFPSSKDVSGGPAQPTYSPEGPVHGAQGPLAALGLSGTLKRLQLALWEAYRWLQARVPFASQLLRGGPGLKEKDDPEVNGLSADDGRTSGSETWASGQRGGGGGRGRGRGRRGEGGSGEGQEEGEALQPLIPKPAPGAQPARPVNSAAEEPLLSERSLTEPPMHTECPSQFDPHYTGSAPHDDFPGTEFSRGDSAHPSALPLPVAEQGSHAAAHGPHTAATVAAAVQGQERVQGQVHGQGQGQGQGQVNGQVKGQVQRSVGASLVLTSLRIRVPGSLSSSPSSPDLLFGPLGLSFSLSPSQSLLIMGPSGCGKSSLLRVISGLWSSGEGSIQCPRESETFFLPQKPYMTLGSLREQLLFPGLGQQEQLRLRGNPGHEKGASAVEDRELLGLLRDVCLPDIAERFPGGLDEDRDWCATLSVGEQQRVAFARLLLHRPGIAFLDEATSALDAANERGLYALLRQRVGSFVSVGHRLSLVPFHSHVLWFDAEKGAWSLLSSEEFSQQHAIVVEFDAHSNDGVPR